MPPSRNPVSVEIEKIKSKLSTFFNVTTLGHGFSPIQFIQENNQVLLLYQSKKTNTPHVAVSVDGFSFSLSEKKIPHRDQLPNYPKSFVVDNYIHRHKQVMFFGDRDIRIAYNKGAAGWQEEKYPVLVSPRPLQVGGVFVQKEGLLLLYFSKEVESGITYYNAHIAYFDKTHPSRVLWKTSEPIWKHQDLWPGTKATPLGVCLVHDRLLSYWQVNDTVVYCVVHSGFKYNPNSILRNKLEKHLANPIITPNPDNHWEAFNTFNPAAFQADNKVHILYRAQGFDYISTVGYASTNDGVTIDERLNTPVFYHKFDPTGKINYDLVSGGGLGGCEDPRVTLIGDSVYMVYVAFNGWSPQRLALTSILLEDLLNKRWNWTKPVFISPSGVIDKSGCLLPEKVNGKYVFFHRVFPNILIDFVDDLNFESDAQLLRGEHVIKVRHDKWDSRKIGAGAPPIKTKDGWLLIYYGVNDRDASKYHIGAMLLDLTDPTKVLYRTDHPIVEPNEDYENNGFKPGIVYPCGAVVHNDELLVYYGGSDSVVCVASADLNTFLAELKSTTPPHLHSLQVREVTI